MPQTWYINGRHMGIDEVRKWRETKDRNVVEEETIKTSVSPKEMAEELDEEMDKEDELEILQQEFEAQEGRPVPNNKKNDAEWIKSKIL